MEAALQKDAFLVFRALCKLSVRASETAAGTDMTAIRGKVSLCIPSDICVVQCFAALTKLVLGLSGCFCCSCTQA